MPSTINFDFLKHLFEISASNSFIKRIYNLEVGNIIGDADARLDLESLRMYLYKERGYSNDELLHFDNTFYVLIKLLINAMPSEIKNADPFNTMKVVTVIDLSKIYFKNFNFDDLGNRNMITDFWNEVNQI
jgi:hypothetical protein